MKDELKATVFQFILHRSYFCVSSLRPLRVCGGELYFY